MILDLQAQFDQIHSQGNEIVNLALTLENNAELVHHIRTPSTGLYECQK